MVQHLIVPVDGSDASWRAVDLAIALGRRAEADIEVVEVVFDSPDEAEASARLGVRLGQRDTSDVGVTSSVVVAPQSVAGSIAEMVEDRPESTVVMASHGRGRSAALLGSVAEELLQKIFGPILVVGPHVATANFGGPVVIAVDGSEASETAVPLGAAWGIEMGAEPWIVEVVDPSTVAVGGEGDVGETAYPARLARRLTHESGHSVQFEVLHGTDVDDELTEYAAGLGASVIVATTHSRTGFARFVLGSTAAALVRHAHCPVLLVRPPNVH